MFQELLVTPLSRSISWLPGVIIAKKLSRKVNDLVMNYVPVTVPY